MQTRTRRQHEVLEYITDFISERGYEPSYQQIARALGVRSKGGIAKHIEALEKQGLILRNRKNGTFGIELQLEQALGDAVVQIEFLNLPELDSAPKPVLVPKPIVGSYSAKNLRAFVVRDDAMIDYHICEGDIVLIERRSFARDRDIVVALVEETTPVLMKIYRHGADVELRPANNAFEPIIRPADRIEVLGVYRALMRPII